MDLNTLLKNPMKFVKDINTLKEIVNVLDVENLQMESTMPSDKLKLLNDIMPNFQMTRENYANELDIMLGLSGTNKTRRDLENLTGKFIYLLSKHRWCLYLTDKLSYDTLKTFYMNLFGIDLDKVENKAAILSKSLSATGYGYGYAGYGYAGYGYPGYGYGYSSFSSSSTPVTPFVFSSNYTFDISNFQISDSKYDTLKKYINDNKLPHKITDSKKYLVISYDNNPDGSTLNFINGLEHYGYDYLIVGNKLKWDGWFGRMVEYRKILSMLDPDQIVIFSDARDVLINVEYNKFAVNLNSLYSRYKDTAKNKIVFSVEVGCCVGTMHQYEPKTVLNVSANTKLKTAPLLGKYDPDILEKWFIEFKSMFTNFNTKYYSNQLPSDYQWINLNFGIMGGKVNKLDSMFSLFNMQSGEDDQHLSSEFAIQNQSGVIIDYLSEVFSNTAWMHYTRSCTVDTEKDPHFKNDFEEHHLKNSTNYYRGNMTQFNKVNRIDTYKYNSSQKNYDFVIKNASGSDVTTTPAFIQSPGKDWNCYNKLVKDLPYSSKNSKTHIYTSSSTTELYKKKYLKYKEKYYELKKKLTLNNLEE
jgi:hypothetical protein